LFESEFCKGYPCGCFAFNRGNIMRKITLSASLVLLLALNAFADTKECDVVFNPSKKFCYDGKVYDLCDGMPYNPTTHICSGDVAARAVCNGMEYNPLNQKCENNALLSICGKTVYNPATHRCKDNTVLALSKCGVTLYDPVKYECRENALFPKCGETLYDPKTQGCKDNVMFPKCGEILYNPKTRGCKDNVIFPKCGEILYDPKTQGCKDNVLLEFSKCGATEVYNPKTHECRFGTVFAKSQDVLPAYKPQQQQFDNIYDKNKIQELIEDDKQRQRVANMYKQKKEIQNLIEEGVEKNKEEIQSKSVYLSPDEREDLYEKNKKGGATGYALLSGTIGLGLGSYIQGNIVFGIAQTVMDGLGLVFTGNDNAAVAATSMIISRVAGIIAPFVHQSNYNATLKSALIRNDLSYSIDPLILPKKNGPPAVGLAFIVNLGLY